MNWLDRQRGALSEEMVAVGNRPVGGARMRFDALRWCCRALCRRSEG